MSGDRVARRSRHESVAAGNSWAHGNEKREWWGRRYVQKCISVSALRPHCICFSAAAGRLVESDATDGSARYVHRRARERGEFASCVRRWIARPTPIKKRRKKSGRGRRSTLPDRDASGAPHLAQKSRPLLNHGARMHADVLGCTAEGRQGLSAVRRGVYGYTASESRSSVVVGTKPLARTQAHKRVAHCSYDLKKSRRGCGLAAEGGAPDEAARVIYQSMRARGVQWCSAVRCVRGLGGSG